MDINEARKQLTSCADTGDTPSAWAKEAAEYCKRKGIFNGDGAGNFGWQQPITREAVALPRTRGGGRSRQSFRRIIVQKKRAGLYGLAHFFVALLVLYVRYFSFNARI